MHKLNAVYEVLRFPIQVVCVGILLLSVGGYMSGTMFSTVASVDNTTVIMLGKLLGRIGIFIIANIPFLFLLRLTSRKIRNGVSVLSAAVGYAAFTAATMFRGVGEFPSEAYSSILGISISATNGSVTRTVLPLQTGMIAAIVVAVITIRVCSSAERKIKEGNGNFMTGEIACFVWIFLLSSLAGVLVGWLWKYVILLIEKDINYIASDTTNPLHLAIYGMTERVLGILNMGALIRQPFWYGMKGGSWIDIAGNPYYGDVNIWTRQVMSSSVTGTAGRFMTPYYLLNLFAVPGFIRALYSLNEDETRRRKSRPVYFLLVLLSVVCGGVLPAEMTIVLVCPILFVFHVLITGGLYALLWILQITLGYYSLESPVLTALPGTLPEILTYASNPAYRGSVLRMLPIGIAVFLLYFLLTRFCIKNLGIGVLNPNLPVKKSEEILKALGGAENIRNASCSFCMIRVQVFDIGKVSVERLQNAGVVRTRRKNDLVELNIGAGAYKICTGIRNNLRIVED